MPRCAPTRQHQALPLAGHLRVQAHGHEFSTAAWLHARGHAREGVHVAAHAAVVKDWPRTFPS